ncbi:MAG: hypothetical protein JWL75_370 [Parcubacteria group bacterium]|nr:hypothetical protein [Parcubacteria group bacterium]
MVICPHCKSRNVSVNNGNFARVKPEGIPAAKHTYDIRFFYCEACEEKWESTPESQSDYYDYVRLRDRTQMSAQEVRPGETYIVGPHIEPGELMRRGELAVKIVDLYTSVLDLSPSEWHEIHLDAGPSLS